MKMNVAGRRTVRLDEWLRPKNAITTRCSASAATAAHRRHQEGVPQARGEVPPGQESRRRRGRGEVQGSGGSVRRALRRREARALRPLRPPGRAAGWAASIPISSPTSATSSATCSASAISSAPARQRSTRPARGNDLRYDLTLEFEDAVFGKDVTLDVPRIVTCTTCSGSGREAGHAAGDLHAAAAAADRSATRRASSPSRAPARNAAAREK